MGDANQSSILPPLPTPPESPPPTVSPPPLAETPAQYSSPPPPPESPPPPPESPPPSSSSSLAPILGSVAGVVAFVAVVAALAVFLVRRRPHRQRRREEGDAGPEPQWIPSPSPLLGSQRKRLGEHEGYNKDIVGIRTFTYDELSKATNEFSKDKFLGRGGFGSVYQGVLASDGVVVAIKQLQTGSFQGEREFVTEINVISRVHHRNLVSLVGYCISGSERLLVYEYVENNNLAFHLQGNVTPVLDWPARMNIALGAAKGIAYLHEECHPRIIHRDIKSANILLDSNLRAKVADFGLAKFVLDNQSHVTTRIMGTFGYLAPEILSSGRMTEKADVFSFGVVLLELITGREPMNLAEWARLSLEQAILEDGEFEVEYIDPKLADNYDHEEMIRMITCALTCVHRFPDNRPRMNQVVQVLEGNISPEKLKAK